MLNPQILALIDRLLPLLDSSEYRQFRRVDFLITRFREAQNLAKEHPHERSLELEDMLCELEDKLIDTLAARRAMFVRKLSDDVIDKLLIQAHAEETAEAKKTYAKKA